MIDMIESADDMLAVRVSHKISGEDLDIIIDRLEATMARHAKTHVFVETQAIDSIELTGLPSYVNRALPLFSKLKKFGRVAVVADQAWVRFGTRVESALLPFISYKTFTPERRAEALAWVEGHTSLSIG